MYMHLSLFISMLTSTPQLLLM